MGAIPHAASDETSHANPKRKRGIGLTSSLTLRVSVTSGRAEYNANAFDSPHFGLKPTRSPFMRLVALSGLLICSLVATLRAAGNDADRFLETAKKLIQAINDDDSPAIQASFDAPMQQALPPDK